MKRETEPAHPRLRVLLVEDDEDDYVLTRALLAEAEGARFELQRARTVAEALGAIRTQPPDVVLLDYRLGEETGLDFLGRLPVDLSTPVILLTGQEERAADVAAMKAGAADYLVKGEVTPGMLERSIRHAIEQARLEEVLRLRDRAVGAISEGVLLTDPHRADDPIIYVNPAFEQMTGFTADEVLGRNCRFLQGPGTDPEAVSGIRAALAAERAITVELLNYRKDGTPFWNRLSISPVQDVSGTLSHFVGVQQDVTERRQAEDALRASEQSYRSLFASVKELLYVQDLEGRFLDVNEAVLKRYGYSREEIIGRTPAMLACPEWQGLEEALASVARAAAGEPQEIEWCSQTKSGETFFKELSLSRGEYFGEPVVIAVGRDVSDRKRADMERERLLDELRSERARLASVIQQAPAFMAVARGPDHVFEVTNPEYERLAGRTGLRGRPVREALPEVVEQGVIEILDEVYATGRPFVAKELPMLLRRGAGGALEERILNFVYQPLHGATGAVTGILAHGVDVTDEVKSSRELRLLARALEALEQGVSITDEQGRFIYANAAHARILGYDPAELEALGPGAFMPDDESRTELSSVVETVQRDGIWNGRLRRQRISDGRVIVIEMTMSKVVEGTRTLFFTLVQDASETITREQQLRRMERLASMGTTLGGVAHELNNPLSSIQGFVDLLLMDPRPPEEREDLQVIRREADRMAKIVSDLRIVARQTQEEAQREVLDLNDVVRHVLRVRDYTLRTSNIRVRQDLSENLPEVWADRGQVEQVLVNLVVNAEQAMVKHRGEGLLIIRTRASRKGVTLQVFDDGPGILPDHLDRIFDAFFTTKSPQEGTGLGLPLVHSIVTDHGGEVHVDSEVGRGTTFRIDLPRAAAREHGAHPARAAPSTGGSPPLRVLVVDDEAAIRRAVARFLTRRGHRVDEAPEGTAALEALLGADYDVILSDLRMPGLSGAQLLEHLQRDHPGMEHRLLFMTGDIGPEAMQILARTNVPVLEKPFDMTAMARAVEVRGEPRMVTAG